MFCLERPYSGYISSVFINSVVLYDTLHSSTAAAEDDWGKGTNCAKLFSISELTSEYNFDRKKNSWYHWALMQINI